MNFKEYQEEVVKMPLYDNVLYGLIGELGECIELIKKSERQGSKKQVFTHERIEEEFSDVLWYLARAMNIYGVDMNEAAKNNIKKLKKRHGIE